MNIFLIKGEKDFSLISDSTLYNLKYIYKVGNFIANKTDRSKNRNMCNSKTRPFFHSSLFCRIGFPNSTILPFKSIEWQIYTVCFFSSSQKYLLI